MNQIKKKQMREIVASLHEGTQALRGEKAEVLDPVWLENIGFFGQLSCMLGDYFIHIGQDDLTQVVESYCQKLKELESLLDQKKPRQKAALQAREILEQLDREIQAQIPADKKELVFLPYLYAMWDSMESVWLAAVDSGDYEVYVIPIPYYERNSDGSLGQMHYDGAEYPPEVQAVDWQSYSLAERKPDVIYVHNPYDDGNYITSIHPDYYSEKLIQYTQSLVYIPYFMGILDQVPAHFCVTPVTLRAHKIIVQSEVVREIYVEEIYKWAQENGQPITKERLRQSILPLGSPKEDKARQSVRYTGELPEAWNKVIAKADGSRKPVIFYNTTITTVLEEGEEAFVKMEDTLATFRGLSAEVALLWRPHPLLEFTLKSMRPQWHRRYVAMVTEYMLDGWGILDESSDFTRAIALSDGYYGDPSSAVEVFRNTGKPIMMRNLNLLYQGKG